MQMQVPPFRLYGLLGCPHCVEAQNFLIEQGVPTLIVVGNDDPIVEAGIKAVLAVKKGEPVEQASFPMLVCTFGNQIIEGFKRDEYQQLVDAYRVLFNSPRPPDAAISGQQPNAQVASEAAPVAAGAN